MATTAEIRNGLCIEYNHDIFQFVEFQHVKPGKGNAFVRCKMKSFRTGRLLEHTFPAGHDIVTARVVRKPYQFLYKDDMGFNFMDQETFDQIVINGDIIENNDFLRDGDVCDVVLHEETEQILACELPQHVVLEITYSEPAVAGNTATNATSWRALPTSAPGNRTVAPYRAGWCEPRNGAGSCARTACVPSVTRDAAFATHAARPTRWRATRVGTPWLGVPRKAAGTLATNGVRQCAIARRYPRCRHVVRPDSSRDRCR